MSTLWRKEKKEKKGGKLAISSPVYVETMMGVNGVDTPDPHLSLLPAASASMPCKFMSEMK